MQRLSRRQFVVGVGSAALLTGCGRLPWQAEAPPVRMPRVGFLSVSSHIIDAPRIAAFRQGLNELGYLEGTNIVIEDRWAMGELERLPGLTRELVQLPVDVLVANGDAPIRSAREATSTVPIIMGFSADPVRLGFVDSLARPGGNITGLSTFTRELAAKRLELLKDTIPRLSHVGVLWVPSNLGTALALEEMEVAATQLGMRLRTVEVRSPEDFVSAFDAAVAEGVGALRVTPSGLISSHQARIVELAAWYRLPTLCEARDWVLAGALMSYGPSMPQQYRRAAYYVDRILKGASPADLPVEQPMTFDFVVNMKTARALGITFPHEVALQITEVIE